MVVVEGGAAFGVAVGVEGGRRVETHVDGRIGRQVVRMRVRMRSVFAARKVRRVEGAADGRQKIRMLHRLVLRQRNQRPVVAVRARTLAVDVGILPVALLVAAPDEFCV